MDDDTVNPPVLVPNGAGEHHWIKIFVYIAITVALVAGVAYGYWYVQKSEPVSVEVPSGKIYITAVKGDGRTADIYAYDTTQRALTKGSSAFEDGNFARYTSSLSKDKGHIAYFAAEVDKTATSTYPFKTVLNLISFPTDNSDNWKILTTGSEFLKLDPRWSPSGDAIAFNAFTGDFSKDSIVDVNAWSIFISYQDDTVIKVDVGVYPHWSPDGTHLLYEKSDGLYEYDVSSMSAVRVKEFEYSTSRATQFSLSLDGSMLVLSNEAESLTVYRIVSWRPLTLQEVHTIAKTDSRLFQPVFSPNGQQIAVLEEVTQAGRAYPPAVYLSVFGTENDIYQRLFDLASEFKPTPIFISDWR